MGGVLGKRPRVAAAPDADDAGGVPDHRNAAGLDEKGLSGRAVARVEDEARGGLADAAGPKDKELAEESGRAVAHVDVQPIDARAQGNGDCPRAADLTVRLFLPKDKEVTEGSGRTVDGVLDHTDHAVAAGLDEKALSGRAVARVEVQQPIDARAQGNGDLTQAEGRKLVDIGSTGGAASSGQPQQQQQDEEDKEHVEARGGLAVQSVDDGATGGAACSGQQFLQQEEEDEDEEVVERDTFPFDQLQVLKTWKKKAMVLDKLILRKIRPLRQAVLAGNFRRSKVTFFGQRIEGSRKSGS